MCGIVGVIAKQNVSSLLLDGLKKLEYRGYDSAGLCVGNSNEAFQRLRALGKVSALRNALEHTPLSGTFGIAHTRWATHGAPSENNAHPLVSHNSVAVVHNGIIENHTELRARLQKLGYTFESETDSETAAHLIHYYLEKTQDFAKTLIEVSKEMHGAFALGVMCTNYPQTLGFMRQGSPLVVGIGPHARFIASDPLAVMPEAEEFIYLEEGDIGILSQHDLKLFDAQGNTIARDLEAPLWKGESVDKGTYRHFMLKEIYEQPRVISDTLEGRIGNTKVFPEILGNNARNLLEKVERVHIVACGTSYHAGLVAGYWFESIAGLLCRVEVASEFRYRKSIVSKGTLFITISQSGETADTLAALRHAKTCENYVGFLAICNVPGSALVRESEYVLMTRAGVEIGVASTKAFTAQLTALLLLVQVLIKTDTDTAPIVDALKSLPALCMEILKQDKNIQALAPLFEDKQHALFLGRGTQYPIALEGALKLKEISYIHAEGYPAGELKHGPLALVDKTMPVIVLAPDDALLEKLKSNIEEVRTRGGQCLVFADEASNINCEYQITLPPMHPILIPIAYTIPLQLLAYHVAVLKGTDVDQPRNLAKSVTVE